MAFALAFYTGTGDWRDRLIRFVTRSPYSHVEFVWLDGEMDGKHLCVSASPRDGGVRHAYINLSSGRWEVVDLVFELPVDLIGFWSLEDGAGYDWYGLVFSQFFNLRRHRTNRWFCSEICAAALGLPHPAKYSPGELKDMVVWLNGRAA